jgi:hypothetical protein
MATYKEILGTAVQNFAGDPANPINGQVWYNSANGSFKYQVIIPTGAWATSANINTARRAMGSEGTQTAALIFGGFTTVPVSAVLGETESYNGTSW